MTSISLADPSQKSTIEWTNIPAGTFMMGSPTSEANRDINETQHQVTLSAFKMSRYELTIGQFKVFIDSTGYVTDADKGTGGVYGSFIKTGIELVDKAGVNWKCDENGNLRPATEYNFPVIHVSWNDAKAFADWYGDYPTKAQTNPKGPATGLLRVGRGGSWNYLAQYCRSAARSADRQGERNFTIGFRLVSPGKKWRMSTP